MSDEPSRLRREAQDLRTLAHDVEHGLDPADAVLGRLAADGDFRGPIARDTEDGLHSQVGRLHTMAENLRLEARRREARAARIESETPTVEYRPSWG